MHAYILLDRSGSMQSLWVEALSSVNAYAKELANKKDGDAVDSHITLGRFYRPQFTPIDHKVGCGHDKNS